MALGSYAPFNVKPQGVRGGDPRVIDKESCPLGRNVDFTLCSNNFPVTETVTLGAGIQHSFIVPWLLTPPPPTLGHKIDWRIKPTLTVDCANNLSKV